MLRINERLASIGVHMAAVVALADQFSKWWILNSIMSPRPHVVEVAPFFNLVLSWNRGITFGILNGDHSWTPYVFVASSGLVLAFLTAWLFRASRMAEALALGLVIGGAVGNMIDRVRYGAVVDFLDFHMFDFHWYAFNVADSAIVCGVGLILFDQLITGEKKEQGGNNDRRP